MKKYIAVRATSLAQAKAALPAETNLINANCTQLVPALRNLQEGLMDAGLPIAYGDYGLEWLLVEDGYSPEQYMCFSCVELAFTVDWLRQKMQLIRFLKGTAYCEASATWGKKLPLKSPSRTINVQFKHTDCDLPEGYLTAMEPEPEMDLEMINYVREVHKDLLETYAADEFDDDDDDEGGQGQRRGRHNNQRRGRHNNQRRNDKNGNQNNKRGQNHKPRRQGHKHDAEGEKKNAAPAKPEQAAKPEVKVETASASTSAEKSAKND